jgi:hypothetical protein
MAEGGLILRDRRLWIVLLVVGGIVLLLLPGIIMPQNIITKETLSDANDHRLEETLKLKPGEYEVWMTEGFFSLFNLDLTLVYVNQTQVGPVHVDNIFSDKDRKFEGHDCRQFAKFEIDEEDEYHVTVIAVWGNLGIPETNRVYVAEARPSVYGMILWTGGILLTLGVVLGVIVAFQKLIADSKKDYPGQPPGGPPPPGQYQHPYPPPGQYPPPAQYPGYPPPHQPPGGPSYPGYPPPQQQQYPPPQQPYYPPPTDQRRRPPPPR